MFDNRPQMNSGHTRAMKQWVQQVFSLDDDVTIMVTELRCNEPNCPPFETVIALWAMDAPARQYKIHKAIIEVNYQDIQQLVLVTDNE
jgi:hypothetical protein